MRNRLLTAALLGLILLLSGCQAQLFATPPPGWRSPVYPLLLDETNFPQEWQLGYDVPEHAKGPTTNHVTREWWQRSGSGIANQSIWRAYTLGDAQEKYAELNGTQYQPSRPLPSTALFVEFTRPPEIDFQSAAADQIHFACGWWDKAYCLTIARYRNYVVLLRIDRQAEWNGHTTAGMTDAEIENLNREMDARLSEFVR